MSVLNPPLSPTSTEIKDVEPNNLRPFLSPFSIQTYNIKLSNFKLPLPNNNKINTPFFTILCNFFAFHRNLQFLLEHHYSFFRLLQTTTIIQINQQNFHNLLTSIYDCDLADCCLLHDISISTVRQISSLLPSTINSLHILFTLPIDFEVMNYWPHFNCRRSAEFLALSKEIFMMQ